MRRFTVLTIALVLLLALGVAFWQSLQRSRYGFTLTRYGDETIRISWGTPSGVNISPEHTLRSFLGYELEQNYVVEFPRLSTQGDIWMYSVEPEVLGSATPASYVNPLNDNAFDQMFQMIGLCKTGNSSSDAVTRIAAQNYTYLGWVVMNDDDARSLASALASRSRVALNENIKTSNGILYRLTPGVERQLASDANDQIEFANIRRTIPVMYEVLNTRAGHPCDAMHVLYLDGHVERIPMGDRFPATTAFIESFPPPHLYR